MRLEKLRDHSEMQFIQSTVEDEYLIRLRADSNSEWTEHKFADYWTAVANWEKLKNCYIFFPEEKKELTYKLVYDDLADKFNKKEEEKTEKLIVKQSLLKGNVFPHLPTHEEKLKAFRRVERVLSKSCVSRDMCDLEIYPTRAWFWSRRVKDLPPFTTKKSERYHIYNKKNVIEWLRDEIEYFKNKNMEN